MSPGEEQPEEMKIISRGK